MIPAGAGGVTEFDDYGMADYDHARAQRVSDMARFAPDSLGFSTKSSWDEPWEQIIAAQKPEAWSLVGDDVFGPPTFSATTRNMLYDNRGEAAFNPHAYGAQVPEWASDVGWRQYAVWNGPSSTGTACGTCGSEYEGKSSVQKSTAEFSSGAPAAAYKGFLGRVKSAFFV